MNRRKLQDEHESRKLETDIIGNDLVEDMWCKMALKRLWLSLLEKKRLWLSCKGRWWYICNRGFEGEVLEALFGGFHVSPELHHFHVVDVEPFLALGACCFLSVLILSLCGSSTDVENHNLKICGWFDLVLLSQCF